MITSLMLLTQDECARANDDLKALRSSWTPRGGQPASFFTLGAPSYLDDESSYMTRAGETNPLLRNTFGWLYDKLCEFLSWRLGMSVGFAEPLALPGFHIWEAGGIFTKPEASVHFDLQYRRHWRPEMGTPDLTRPLSFTLALRLPRRGGGLNVWDVTLERFARFRERAGDRVQPADIAVLLPPMRHPYVVGGLSLHSGHQLHQIGEIDHVDPDDERVTLQGHALLVDGMWKLYW